MAVRAHQDGLRARQLEDEGVQGVGDDGLQQVGGQQDLVAERRRGAVQDLVGGVLRRGRAAAAVCDQVAAHDEDIPRRQRHERGVPPAQCPGQCPYPQPASRHQWSDPSMLAGARLGQGSPSVAKPTMMASIGITP